MKIFIVLCVFLLSGCAKLSYITEQGWGQMRLQWKGRDVAEVLADSAVSEKQKQQIREIQQYKKFFYQYFGKKENAIYSKVTFLETEAVSHLVISAPYNAVEAHKEWFPFLGEFPYLGFFKKKSAEAYAQKMREEQFHTYVRPVYAYSTVGYFEDRILSSFFQYDQFEMAEMIFHELFHTIFFVKDDVPLNENLANYFGKELVKIYFKEASGKVQEHFALETKRKALNVFLVQLIEEYKKRLATKDVKDLAGSYEFLNSYLESEFRPKLKDKCKQLNFKTCKIADEPWNHASFAAYMTYEKKIDVISKLGQQLNLGPKEFYELIVNEYEKIDDKEKFFDHLSAMLK